MTKTGSDVAKAHLLISYIAPGAPATRRPATGEEPFLRPEIGFTPNWYFESSGIDFGARWHHDPRYRLETRIRMIKELKQRFPEIPFSGTDDPCCPDVLTGVFGVLLVPAIYGARLRFGVNSWPDCSPIFHSRKELYDIEPPNLNRNSFFSAFMEQLDWIKHNLGVVKGFIVGQGVLNNAFRLRGKDLFVDMIKDPGAVNHFLQCITMTILEVAARVHTFQRSTGFDVQFFTISNCLVNMVSPQAYKELLLPYDVEIARHFLSLGIHNCAWDATPYFKAYASISNVGYIDMGIESDLKKARALFPNARRAVMYRTADLRDRTVDEIERDLELIAATLGPCDVVFADIDTDIPDQKIKAVHNMCKSITEKYSEKEAKGG